MNAATTSRFQSVISPASRQRSARRRSMSSSRRSMRLGPLGTLQSVGRGSDDMGRTCSRRPCPYRHTGARHGPWPRATRPAEPRRVPGTGRVVARGTAGRCWSSFRGVGEIRFGPSGLPPAESFEDAMGWLRERGYDAVEVGFVNGFWLDYEGAARLRAAAEAADVVLSVHAPLAAFMGHADRSKKFKMALGMLDHTAGLAKAAGARIVVFHPGFLLGRERADAVTAVVDQLGDVHDRLAAKDRLLPLGAAVVGRGRHLGPGGGRGAISPPTPPVR